MNKNIFIRKFGIFIFSLVIFVYQINIIIHGDIHYKKQYPYDWLKNPNLRSLDSKLNSKNVIEKKRKVFVMSFFTNYYDDVNEWRFFRSKNDYKKECGFAFRNCRLNYNKSNWRSSDIVFFHGKDMPETWKLEKMKKLGKPGQLWVYFIMESTTYTPDHSDHLNHLFEIVSSYRRTSDMFNPYGQYENLTNEEKIIATKNHKNYAKGKTNQIYWIVTHCGEPREKLVHLLEDYGLEIHVGGGCDKRFKKQLGYFDDAKLRSYKFYFAFENSFCSDYITEKYWYTPFKFDNIPIVLGGGNYDSKVSIPGSFINAFDFKSPKELAEYIKKVASNDTLYNQYFEWKKQYKVHQNFYYNNGCAKSMDLFCQKLHKDFPILKKNVLINSINKTKECDGPTKYYYDWLKK